MGAATCSGGAGHCSRKLEGLAKDVQEYPLAQAEVDQAHAECEISSRASPLVFSRLVIGVGGRGRLLGGLQVGWSGRCGR